MKMDVPSLSTLLLPRERESIRHYFRYLLDFLQHVSYSLFHFARRSAGLLANMASRVDSKMPDDVDHPTKRQMVHLKTKEECRLGNETIQVWTVELPSKHAEGILKWVNGGTHSFTLLIVPQSHQSKHRWTGLHRLATPTSLRQAEVSTPARAWKAGSC